MAAFLTIALAKGRLQDEALNLLRQNGLRICRDELSSRRLAVTDAAGCYRFIFVKPADVPLYVTRGIADGGIVGRDVLWEAGANLWPALDLGLGRCRLALAGPRGRRPDAAQPQRVATKYPRIAAEFFARRGWPAELITLAGSVELAPLLGLSDLIVDLVETGRTLAENGLEVLETIGESTAQLAVNRAAYQTKRPAFNEFIALLQAAGAPARAVAA
jgi:ATP phosphoribosyltransferase